MATKPTVTASWATDVVNEPVVIGGNTLLVTNKVEPTQEFKDSGGLARENLPRPYINYQFDLIDQWLKHLDERYAIGDYHLGASGDTAGAVSTRLGGTWVSHGTDTVAGQTVQLFEKTA